MLSRGGQPASNSTAAATTTKERNLARIFKSYFSVYGIDNNRSNPIAQSKLHQMKLFVPERLRCVDARRLSDLLNQKKWLYSIAVNTRDMDLRYIRRLFSYDAWANREVVNALCKLDAPPARSLRFLAHILSAERLWLERLRHETQTHPVWPEFNLARCEPELEEIARLWKTYLGSIREQDLFRPLTYKNTKGENWTSEVQDILMHVILHSAYHRGQIAADMRAAGFSPPNTDFIHGVRQGLVDQVP